MLDKKYSLVLIVASAFAAVAACHSSADEPLSPAPPGPVTGTAVPLPSDLSSPSVYVAKVKNILVGLPPTDDEISQVQTDPTKLMTLIDKWMAQPEYQSKMLRFFQLAFQQTQVDDVDFDAQSFPGKVTYNNATSPQLVQDLTESFARTVLELLAEGRPLTDALTTRSFMMTPALMEIYAYFDTWQTDDASNVYDRFTETHPGQQITVTQTQVPLAESVDPTSPNYMHWYYANLAKEETAHPGCFPDPFVYPAKRVTAERLHRILTGSVEAQGNGTDGKDCGNAGGTLATSQLSPEDFTTWKMVATRPPNAGEKPTEFYDIPKLRAASELVLTVPRVGFFSTPAFFANWQTNTSNQMRVTMNQALIVALGAQIDGTDTTHPSSTPGLEATHAKNPDCVGCHQTLDPTRSIFAASWSWGYHNQTEQAFATQPGLFVFQGVEKPVASLDDFGATLGAHPLFAQAWAQKLCYYANSRKCAPDDPELQRIVKVFQDSKYSWSALVREVMASPLTTNAAPTKTLSDNGEIIAVSRRDHLCASLSNRLGFPDLCSLNSDPGKNAALRSVNVIASGLPSDGYGRGAVAPVLPNEPSLFYRAGVENICESVAQLVIDNPKPMAGTKQWSSTQSDSAIAELVQLLMGLSPSDPRTAPSTAELKAHFAAATQSGATPTDALKSTFVLACLAPSSISIGL